MPQPACPTPLGLVPRAAFPVLHLSSVSSVGGWITLSDGRVTVYGVCPPDRSQRCRIEHCLACSKQPAPDLWPCLTALRAEHARAAQRRTGPEPPRPPQEWPNAG
nr:DUF6083 domain-containing protein [Streptomyces qaidamensis]